MPSDMHPVSSEGLQRHCPVALEARKWLFSQSTGVTFPPTCRRWSCGVCGPRRLRKYGRAIDRAGYQFWTTLTRAPSDARQGVARVRYLLAQTAPIEWAWTLERGGKTGMIHAHLCVRASQLDYKEVSRAARRAGWGRVAWSRRVLDATHAGQYASKAAYASKASLRPEAWEEHLALNGGRGWHFSRGYPKPYTVREYIARHTRPGDPGPFVWVDPPLGGLSRDPDRL